MPDFKVRRKILAVGGIDVTGTASFSGPIAAGSAGAAFNDLIWGSACLNCPSALGGAVVVGGSLAVSGVTAADKLFVTPMSSLQAGMMLLSACCITGGISASWINAGSPAVSASADIPVSYLIIS